jgi:ParB-like chromosome segregation protein Spo0J
MATSLEGAELPIDRLLLDPNNYRFQDEQNYVTADLNRFHEETVQDRAFRRIRNEGLLELKNSILTNGFLAVERLVVRRYAAKDDHYVVVEGNRRLAALRWICNDYEAGVPVPDHVIEVTKAVPVLVLESDDDESAYLSIMGVRHVGGIRQWGGYQRAKLVTELKDRHSLDGNDIAGRLGMSTQEVNRRYRAFKALQQMQEHEEYGDRATPQMYPLFHEAVSVPVVRKWMGWSDTESKFTDEDQLTAFYELVAPTEIEEGVKKDPKITTYSQVRELRTILQNPEAKRVLLDPTRSFHEAVGIAKAEELSRAWATQVAEAVSALNAIGALELRKLSREDLAEIERLRDLSQELLAAYEKLTTT